MTLSIVIPTFNEQNKIARDVDAAAQFLLTQQMRGEILVVDDGSSDATATLARQVQVPSLVSLSVIRNDIHRGKGFAIRTGVLASQGEYVMFADCGLTVPFENALAGIRLLQEGDCELAHGSRKLTDSIIRKEQDWDRKLISRLFRWFIIRWMHVPPHLTDTQCGFKVYRGDVAHMLYAECRAEGFMFDIEIILRALQRGYRIREFPLSWSCDRDSRLNIVQSPWPIMRELIRIRRAGLTTPGSGRT